MHDVDDNKFKDSNRQTVRKNFWVAEFDGDPVWYLMAMIIIGIYFGAAAETLRFGGVVVALAITAAIISILLLHVVTRCRGR